MRRNNLRGAIDKMNLRDSSRGVLWVLLLRIPLSNQGLSRLLAEEKKEIRRRLTPHFQRCNSLHSKLGLTTPLKNTGEDSDGGPAGNLGCRLDLRNVMALSRTTQQGKQGCSSRAPEAPRGAPCKILGFERSRSVRDNALNGLLQGIKEKGFAVSAEKNISLLGNSRGDPFICRIHVPPRPRRAFLPHLLPAAHLGERFSARGRIVGGDTF
jgi:hypothetical protein